MLSQCRILEKNDINFLFSKFFLVPQRGFMKAFRPSENLFKALQRSVKIKFCHFSFQFFSMLGIGKIKFFLLGFSIKLITNRKLGFTNVPFRYNAVCVIQKWLRFKRVVITVRLALCYKYKIQHKYLK